MQKWTSVIALLTLTLPVFANPTWKLLRPGLEAAVVDVKQSDNTLKVIAFRINPKKNRFSIQLADKTAFVGTLGSEAKALVAINGGYYSEELTPLGLRISNGKILSKARPITWWGVFYLQGSYPKIVPTRRFIPRRNIRFAVQAGPRLVIRNKIPRFKAGVDERSAIGITRKHEVILAVTSNSPMKLHQWAKVLKNDLSCPNALNLDGGTSSQLYSVYSYNVRNYKPITDAIIVK